MGKYTGEQIAQGVAKDSQTPVDINQDFPVTAQDANAMPSAANIAGQGIASAATTIANGAGNLVQQGVNDLNSLYSNINDMIRGTQGQSSQTPQDTNALIASHVGKVAASGPYLHTALSNISQQPDGAQKIVGMIKTGLDADQHMAQQSAAPQTGVSTGDGNGAATLSKTRQNSGIDSNAQDINLSTSDQQNMYSQADQEERTKAKQDEADARKLGDSRKPKVGAWDYLAALAGVTTPTMAEATSFGQQRGGGYGALGPAVTQVGMASQLPMGTEQRRLMEQNAQFRGAELLGGAAARGLEAYKAGGENMFGPLKKMGRTNQMMDYGKDMYLGTQAKGDKPGTVGAQQQSINAASNLMNTGKNTVQALRDTVHPPEAIAKAQALLASRSKGKGKGK